MSATRRTLLIALVAVLGIVIAAAITWGTSQLVRQRIGLASEPLTAGTRLLPSAAGTRTAQPPSAATGTSTGSRSTGAPQATAPAPSPAPAASAPASAGQAPAPSGSGTGTGTGTGTGSERERAGEGAAAGGVSGSSDSRDSSARRDD
jgi:hypothetical protein